MKNTPHSPVLGILGGLGPMSSVYFYELITAHTAASCDSDHIDLLISSRATTPDRTAFITGMSDKDPLPVMMAEASRLTDAGAQLIAMPCNTAHFFYDELCRSCGVPVLNIIALTVGYAVYCGANKLGVLATDGTIISGAYRSVCEMMGIGYVQCQPSAQRELMDIIYGSVKRGLPPDMDKFNLISRSLSDAGCDRLILGCTELSLIKKMYDLPEHFIDSLDVLAACTISACGKELRGFSDELVRYAAKQKTLLKRMKINK